MTQQPRRATPDLLQDKPQENRPPRVKPLRTVKDVEEVSYFSDEDRRVAISLLTRSLDVYQNQPTIGVCCAMHEPQSTAAKFAYGEALERLCNNKGLERHTTQGSLHWILMLIAFRAVNDENLVGALSQGNLRSGAIPGFKPHHVAMIDFPDSEVWNPEQRLMIRYANALNNDAVTDELWAEVVRTWGVQKAIRYIYIMGHYRTTALRNRTLRVPHPMYREAIT